MLWLVYIKLIANVGWNCKTDTILYLWGRGTYDLAHALLGPKARAEEGICRGRMGKGRNAGGAAEDDTILGTPRLQRGE